MRKWPAWIALRRPPPGRPLLVGDFDRSPAYAGLAEGLARAGQRRPDRVDTRLPSERELTEALGRLADHRDPGVRRAPRPRLPRRPARSRERRPGARRPRPAATTGHCSPGPAPAAPSTSPARAPSAPPRLAGRRTTRPRPSCRRTSAGDGSYPAGLPELREAVAAVVHRPRAADRPRARSWSRPAPSRACRDRGAGAGRARRPGARRDPDLPQRHRGPPPRGRPAGRVARSTRPAGTSSRGRDAAPGSPRLAYLIPDFHNPTGRADERRAAGASAARAPHPHDRRGRRVAQALALEGQEMPLPFAAYPPAR